MAQNHLVECATMEMRSSATSVVSHQGEARSGRVPDGAGSCQESVPEGARLVGVKGSRLGVLDGDKAKLVVDVSMPTDRDLTTRRPDIIMHLKERNQIVILEVPVAWEPLLEEQEKEKSNKYWELDLVI